VLSLRVFGPVSAPTRHEREIASPESRRKLGLDRAAGQEKSLIPWLIAFRAARFEWLADGDDA